MFFESFPFGHLIRSNRHYIFPSHTGQVAGMCRAVRNVGDAMGRTRAGMSQKQHPGYLIHPKLRTLVVPVHSGVMGFNTEMQFFFSWQVTMT